jgi:hypothetical protein
VNSINEQVWEVAAEIVESCTDLAAALRMQLTNAINVDVDFLWSQIDMYTADFDAFLTEQ